MCWLRRVECTREELWRFVALCVGCRWIGPYSGYIAKGLALSGMHQHCNSGSRVPWQVRQVMLYNGVYGMLAAEALRVFAPNVGASGLDLYQ